MFPWVECAGASFCETPGFQQVRLASDLDRDHHVLQPMLCTGLNPRLDEKLETMEGRRGRRGEERRGEERKKPMKETAQPTRNVDVLAESWPKLYTPPPAPLSTAPSQPSVLFNEIQQNLPADPSCKG